MIFNPGLSTMDLIKSLIPFAPHSYSYWFINKFLALLLLQPFIAKLISVLNRRQFGLLLAIMYLLNSELVTGFPLSALFDNGWSLPWMITVFLTGGYIKLYNPMAGFRYWGLVWVISVIIFFLAGYYGNRFFRIEYNQWFFIAKSICFFMFIRTLSINPNSVVGKLTAFFSPNVLSVYLIHNQHLMIAWLIAIGSSMIIGMSAVAGFATWCAYGIAIILVCTLIDKIRIIAFKATGISSAINNVGNWIDRQLRLSPLSEVSTQ